MDEGFKELPADAATQSDRWLLQLHGKKRNEFDTPSLRSGIFRPAGNLALGSDPVSLLSPDYRLEVAIAVATACLQRNSMRAQDS